MRYRNKRRIILHVSTAQSWRGGEQQIINLFEEQDAKEDLKPILFCKKGSELEERARRLDLACISSPKRGAIDLGFAKQLASSVKNEKVDLIHVHDSHAHTALAIAYYFYGCKTQAILHRRVDFPVSGFLSRYKYNLPSIQKIICVSQKVREVLKPVVKDHSKLEVVYSGIDQQRFLSSKYAKDIREKLDLDKDTYVIANVGALEQQKDYFTFIQAAYRIIKQTDKQITFIGFGEGSQRSRLEKLTRKLAIDDKVIFPGFLPDLSTYFASIDLLLFTSEKEGLGTAVIEAMYTKVPIVATEAGGVTELIDHEKHGLLAPVGDDETLSKHALRLMNNNTLRNMVIKSANQRAQFFSKEGMAKRILEIYEKLLPEPE